jgi:PTH1 family peptidyl-tRNA hydrolase
MKILIGLGNPEKKYANHRHNVGFIFIDHIYEMLCKESKNELNNFELNNKFRAKIIKLKNKFILAKPQTYMNLSGIAVKKIKDFYKVNFDSIFIIHDDLDIQLGEFKIQKGKGPKVHNGVSSIEAELGNKNFWRIRIGIENRNKEQKISGNDYVLNNFKLEELNKIKKEIFPKILEKLKTEYEIY